MSDEGANHVSPREAFEYAFRTFLEALVALSASATEAVRLNGNYNTAFELLFDLGKGRGLVSSAGSYLSEAQALAIGNFMDEMERLPFQRHSGREDDPEARLASNLTDMLHPSWEPARRWARELIPVLAPAALLNRGYFSSLS